MDDVQQTIRFLQQLWTYGEWYICAGCIELDSIFEFCKDPQLVCFALSNLGFERCDLADWPMQTYRNYEFFIVQHIFSVFAFLISLWPHVKVSIPDGLYYVYASVAFWGFSIFIRFFWETAEFAGLGKWKGKATLQGFGGDEMSGKGGATRLVVETKRGSWEVGQYVYLRVPSVNPFVGIRYDLPSIRELSCLQSAEKQSHPFTIASTPLTNSDVDTSLPLTVLISTHSGITKRIARSALSNSSKSIPVIVQGPFGGFGEKLERFDKVLVICGGVGAAMGWPVVNKLIRERRKVKMIWSVRSIGEFLHHFLVVERGYNNGVKANWKPIRLP